MDDLYKSNQLYQTIDLFCKLRLISKSAMCKKAGVSPGIISDLKFGRKQTIQIETAAKFAAALDTTVSAIQLNKLHAATWDTETCLKWNDCDDDSERLSIMYEFGVDATVLKSKENRRFIDRLIIERPGSANEKEKPATETGSGQIPNYSELSKENQEKVAEYVALLLNAQRNQ
jgi:transcriptional regulator with XRE-family HTH domain